METLKLLFYSLFLYLLFTFSFQLQAQSDYGKCTLIYVESYSYDGFWREGQGRIDTTFAIKDGKEDFVIISDSNYKEFFERRRDTVDIWFSEKWVISKNRNLHLIRVANIKKGITTNYSMENGRYKKTATFDMSKVFSHNPIDLKSEKMGHIQYLEYQWKKGKALMQTEALLDTSISYPSKIILPELDIGQGLPIWVETLYKGQGKSKNSIFLDFSATQNANEIKEEIDQFLSKVD